MAASIDEPVDGSTSARGALPSASADASAIAGTAGPVAMRYRALGWLTLAAALAYLCRNALGVAESAIRDQLGLTLQQSGWFMGAFFWSYAMLQVPSGWFAERVGTRIALSIFALGWSAAMFCIGVAPGFWLLIVAQLTMGVAQAGLIPATCNSVGHWMPLTQRSFGCGMLGAGMQVGAIVASGLTGVLMAPLGWRWVFIAFSLPGVLWTVGFVRRFRDRPTDVLQPGSKELALIQRGRAAEPLSRPGSGGQRKRRMSMVTNPTMWWLCGQQICRSAGYMFFASWFPTFLQRTRGASVEASGYMQGVVLGGALFGCVLGGVVTDWVWHRSRSLRISRSGVGAASLGTCSIVILGAWAVDSTELAVLLLALGAFAAAFAGPCALAAAIDIGGTRVPQVSGLLNMTGNLGAAACPIVVGRLFQLTENWNLVLLLFAGVFLAGAVCWIFVDPHRRLQ